MPDFSIPLSGLKAESTALSTISNNLANMNTIGYKDANVTFSDMFYQSLGSSGNGNPEQLGSGTQISSVDTNFTGGPIETTGVSSDVAISGNGFFVVQKDGSYQYTRAGNFKVSNAGFLTSADGDLVMGYPVTNGSVDTAAGLQPLQVGLGQVNPPKTTSELQLSANLDAGASTSDSAFTSPVTVYDSLGDSHVLTISFAKSATNQWNYTVTIPSADLDAASASSGTDTTVLSGTLTFDGNGQLILPTDASGNPEKSLTVNISGFGDGANPLSFAWELQGSNGTSLLTQTASASSSGSAYQDGYGSGTLQKFSIDPDGIVEGTFTNGTKPLGQIVLASFSNQEGLDRVGGSNYAATLASGQAVIGAANTSGRGSLSGGSLENSNVDVSTELSNLIVAQRGFEANAKAITAFDEVMQDTINLKH